MSEKPVMADNKTGDEQKTSMTLEPPSYFDGAKIRGSSEQCTPTVSVTPAPTCDDYDPTTHTNPCSPFYVHPSSTRPSMDRSSKRTITVDVHNTDLEASLTPEKSTSTRQSSDQGAVKEWSGSRWPLGRTCKKSGLAGQKSSKCSWLSRLPKRQRLAVKLGIAIFIIGAMVAIALGISVAVHGTVYKSNNQNAPVVPA